MLWRGGRMRGAAACRAPLERRALNAREERAAADLSQRPRVYQSWLALSRALLSFALKRRAGSLGFHQTQRVFTCQLAGRRAPPELINSLLERPAALRLALEVAPAEARATPLGVRWTASGKLR